MKNIFAPLVSALFPDRCAYCGVPIASGSLSCKKCMDSLPRIKGEICPKCGREKENCSCKKAEMYFERLAAPFYFSGVVRTGIHAFKFRKSPDNYRAYSSETAKTVRERFGGVNFDYITEVPMTAKSTKDRGYNQCALLAKGIAEELGIEYKAGILKKIYETEKQHGLSYYLRKGNLTGVFDVADAESVKDKTVLLCDDISTTGETLNECSKMLWLYGAKEIYCVTTALTKSKLTEKQNDN